MLAERDLSQFTGTEHWYRHPLVKHFVYTDGIKFLAEQAQAYWLIDAIASYQPALRKNSRLQEFQLWELKLNGKGGCTLTCQEDSDKPNVVEQKIGSTDFPFDIKLYVEGDGEHLTCLLSSEH